MTIIKELSELTETVRTHNQEVGDIVYSTRDVLKDHDELQLLSLLRQAIEQSYPTTVFADNWDSALIILSGVSESASTEVYLTEIAEAIKVGKRPYDLSRINTKVWPAWKKSLTDLIGMSISSHLRAVAHS